MLLSIILMGSNDYEVYILKAMIDMHTDNNASLFENLNTLRALEEKDRTGEVNQAICDLMQYRGTTCSAGPSNTIFCPIASNRVLALLPTCR